jgi:hypothetical protein
VVAALVVSSSHDALPVSPGDSRIVSVARASLPRRSYEHSAAKLEGFSGVVCRIDSPHDRGG